MYKFLSGDITCIDEREDAKQNESDYIGFLSHFALVGPVSLSVPDEHFALSPLAYKKADTEKVCIKI